MSETKRVDPILQVKKQSFYDTPPRIKTNNKIGMSLVTSISIQVRVRTGRQGLRFATKEERRDVQPQPQIAGNVAAYGLKI